MATPNMNLTLPTPGTTAGPTWASQLNVALTSVDGHNHTDGYGSRIPVAGLDINDDLDLNQKKVTNLLGAQFQNQTVPISTQNALYVLNNKLCFIDNGSVTSTFNTSAVASIAELRLVTGSTFTSIAVAGYSTTGDGGEGVFTWNATSTAADDGGTIIAPTGVATGRWYRQFDRHHVSPLWYGAKGNYKELTDVVTTAGSAVVTSASGGFANAVIGQAVRLHTPSSPATGTVAITSGSSTMVGTGTAFLAELSLGSLISVNGVELRCTAAPADNTHIQVGTSLGQDPAIASAPGFTVSGATLYRSIRTFTTVASVGSPTSVTLAATSLLSGSGRTLGIGTDDSPPIRTAIAACASLGLRILKFPAKAFLCLSSIPVPSAITLTSDAMSLPGGTNSSSTDHPVLVHQFNGDLLVLNGGDGGATSSGYGVSFLRMVQTWVNANGSSAGDAVKMVALDSAHRPAHPKCRFNIIEEAQGSPWRWAFNCDGELNTSDGVPDIVIEGNSTHVSSSDGGAVRLWAVPGGLIVHNQFYINGDILVSGVSGHPTGSAHILNNLQIRTLILDWATDTAFGGGVIISITDTVNTAGTTPLMPTRLVNRYIPTTQYATGMIRYNSAATGGLAGHFEVTKSIAIRNATYFGGYSADYSTIYPMLGNVGSQLRLDATGVMITAVGAIASVVNAVPGDLVLPKGKSIRFCDQANSATLRYLTADGYDNAWIGLDAAGVVVGIAGGKIGFHGLSPISQQTRAGQITNNSTGSITSAVADVGAAFSQTGLNNIHATILDRINKLETILHNLGITT